MAYGISLMEVPQFNVPMSLLFHWQIFRFSFLFSVTHRAAMNTLPLTHVGVFLQGVPRRGLCWRPYPLSQRRPHYSLKPLLLTREKTEAPRGDSALLRALRAWDRSQPGAPGPSTLPFRNPPFPYFYFSTNPSDHPGGLISTDLGETHYQQPPGGWGSGSAFGRKRQEIINRRELPRRL